MSSPHKCGQESCCSALNAVVAALLLRYFMIFSHLGVPRTQSLPRNLQYVYLIKFSGDPMSGNSSDKPGCLRTQHSSLLGCIFTRVAVLITLTSPDRERPPTWAPGPQYGVGLSHPHFCFTKCSITECSRHKCECKRWFFSFSVET